MYLKVKEQIDDQELTPKITGTSYIWGMLVDLEVFDVPDIIEILTD